MIFVHTILWICLLWKVCVYNVNETWPQREYKTRLNDEVLRSVDEPSGAYVVGKLEGSRLGYAFSLGLACAAVGVGFFYQHQRRQRHDREQDFARMMSQEAQLRSEAVIAERQRIAMDMHDTLEQSLAAMVMHLHVARGTRSSALIRSSLTIAEQLVVQAREELRQCVGNLHSSMLHHKSLQQAIEESCSSLVAGRDIQLLVESRIEDCMLKGASAQHLFFLSREAVANAVKHARATFVSVTIDKHEEFIEIVIEDDGIGFEVDGVAMKTGGRQGLVGMRCRAIQMGGAVEFHKREPHGMCVLISAPLVKPPPARLVPPSYII